MEIRNLYTFLQVASTMNITQAGNLLGYSQSTVSAQIQQLEAELGVQLFDRIGRGIALTQYGRDLIPYARQVIAIIDRLEHFMQTESEMGGTIHVGFVESLFASCFREIVLRYAARFPRVKIDVTVDATATLQRLLLKNDIDLACLIDTPASSLKLTSAYSIDTQVSVVAGSSHPLAAKELVSLSALRDAKFILMEESAPYNVLFQQMLAERGMEIRPTLAMQSCDMARQLVEQSDYVSLLPIYSVKESIDSGKISVVHVPELSISQRVQILYYSQKFITPQITGFLEEATAVLGTLMG